MAHATSESCSADPPCSESRSLIERLYASYNPVYGLSSTSVQIYDTAWAAMITKTVDGHKQWLFPQSFQYLLKAQADDGSWGTHLPTQTAAILDTAAALLALLKHEAWQLQITEISPNDLQIRIDRASHSLRTQLTTWTDLTASNHIGAEMIIPALLDYLQGEDESLSFEFDEKVALMSMHEIKMSQFNIDSLYEKAPSSALHSLEAFIGQIDFNKVKHQLFQGSMLASPSSTAAYLIHSTEWDNEAESYMRQVYENGAGHGDGGIPGTYPTTYFEFSWVIATLLRSRVPSKDVECPELHWISRILIRAFQDSHGLIGFAPRAIDADDTAKGLLALKLLGHDDEVSPEAMIKVFESSNHFRTFGTERDPSLSTNCHVLLTLLHQTPATRYIWQIQKVTRFIVTQWWETDSRIKDKWHFSHLYPTMLMVEAFTYLLRFVDNGTFDCTLDAELQRKVAICLYQACFRTLLEQDLDGSWSQLPEQTAYAVLILAEAQHIYFFDSIQSEIEAAIDRASNFLRLPNTASLDHHWTSKTSYRVEFVAEAYRIAALGASIGTRPTPKVGQSLDHGISKDKLKGLLQLASHIPLLSSLPTWKIWASLLESALFVPLLQARRLDVFPRDGSKIHDDSYLAMIPFTWLVCDNHTRASISTSAQYDMMLLSMLGYQIDEFFEGTAAPAYSGNVSALHQLVDKSVDSIAGQRINTEMDYNNEANGTKTTSSNSIPRKDSFIPDDLSDCSSKVSEPLNRFLTYVLRHAQMLKASTYDRAAFKHELRCFLHAHVVQISINESAALTSTGGPPPGSPLLTTWTRSIGADHVACAYSMYFLMALASARLLDGHEAFNSVQSKHYAAATARHATTMCRLFNDYGSIERDQEEGNVNAVMFDEFKYCGSVIQKREILRELGEWEGEGQARSLNSLEQSVAGGRTRVIQWMKHFTNVSTMYNQIYVVKDMSSRFKG